MAIAAPVFLGLAAVCIDMVSAFSARQDLQNAADGAALAAATELPLRSTNERTVQAIVTAYVETNVSSNVDVTVIDSVILDNRGGVRVNLTGQTRSVFGDLFKSDGYEQRVEAIARLSGGSPLCALALEERAGRAIYADREAHIIAPDCAVVSNSINERGIMVQNSAQLTATMICSAGGYFGGRSNFSPEPITDCPPIPDPLAQREEPSSRGCDHVATISVTGNRHLNPGVYCGGITVLPGATATLSPGVYVMKNGPLKVLGNGALVGEAVGFYFVGDLSNMFLSSGSRIELTAPTSGPMAGFLFFSNRVLLTGNLQLRRFRIESDNARTLLGTIYLRDGILEVASRRPVADQSAYTVIVARRIEVSAGPDLVLNTDYEGTDVPVPNGVGPRQPQAFLAD